MDTVFLAADPKSETGDGVPVYWGRGASRPGCWKGRVFVPVEQFHAGASSREKTIISELLVLRYLLIERQMLGFLRGGNGVAVEFSIGQPRKLAMKKSKDFAHLYRYAEFLRTVFPGLSLKSGKLSANALVGCESFEEESLDAGYGVNPSVYEDTACGSVHLTEHALERFIERHSELGMGEAKNPYKTILRLLKDEDLKMEKLPERVLKGKERKYLGGAAEHWRNLDSPFWFVVVRNDDGSGQLVTVFARHEKYALEC